MTLPVPVDAKRQDWPRLVANAINFLLNRASNATTDNTALAEQLDDAEALAATERANLTGWGNYAHTGGSLSIPANTRTQLLINAGTALQAQEPADIAALWDGTTSRITGRNGDSVGVRVRLVATPVDAVASTIKVEFDISGSTPTAPGVDPIVAARNEPLISGAGVSELMTITELLFMGATFAANGCAIWITCDGPVTISTPSVHIQVTHRAR